jgi:hypothetical protein
MLLAAMLLIHAKLGTLQRLTLKYALGCQSGAQTVMEVRF